MENLKLQNLFSKLEDSKNDRDASTEEKIDKLVSDYLRSQGTNADFSVKAGGRFLFISLMLFLYHEAPDDEQNMFMIAEQIDAAKTSDEESFIGRSILARLFELLEEKDSSHIALEYYNRYLSLRKNREKKIIDYLKECLYPIVCVQDDLYEVLKYKYNGLKSDENIRQVANDYAHIFDSNFNNGEFQKDEKLMKDEIDKLYSIFHEFIKNAITDSENRTIRHLENGEKNSLLLQKAIEFFNGWDNLNS